MFVRNLAALVGRILLVLIFLQSGIEKFVQYSGTLGYMTRAGLPFPEVLLVASGVVETLCAVAVIAGWKARWAAAALVVWMIPVTVIFHNPTLGQGPMIHFMKNLAITGGFLMLFAFGPGAWSVERSR